MKMYSDDALVTIQENTGALYAKLASTKPTEDLTLDDIRSIMFYIKSFHDQAHTEATRRKINAIRNRK